MAGWTSIARPLSTDRNTWSRTSWCTRCLVMPICSAAPRRSVDGLESRAQHAAADARRLARALVEAADALDSLR